MQLYKCAYKKCIGLHPTELQYVIVNLKDVVSSVAAAAVFDRAAALFVKSRAADAATALAASHLKSDLSHAIPDNPTHRARRCRRCQSSGIK